MTKGDVMTKECKKCGDFKPTTEFYKRSGRDSLQSYCKACVKADAVKWKEKNPNKARASIDKWRASNPAKAKAIRAAWYAANTEKSKAKSANWYAANRANVIARTRKWAADNRDKAKASSAKWQAANPEACRIHLHNRRARKLANGGRLSPGLSEKLFKLQRGKCACGCGQQLGNDYHLDHIMPLALGGSNTDDNMQLLTATCNLKKSSKHPVDFMQQRGFLL